MTPTPDLRAQRDALLAALKKAETGLDAALSMVELEGYVPSWDYLRECRAEARAAIAAAEGERG